MSIQYYDQPSEMDNFQDYSNYVTLKFIFLNISYTKNKPYTNLDNIFNIHDRMHYESDRIWKEILLRFFQLVRFIHCDNEYC